MQDFLNQELKIGDKVIMIMQGYRSFQVSEVVGFTPKNVRVEYEDVQYRKGYFASIIQPPQQLIKISPELLNKNQQPS